VCQMYLTFSSTRIVRYIFPLVPAAVHRLRGGVRRC